MFLQIQDSSCFIPCRNAAIKTNILKNKINVKPPIQTKANNLKEHSSQTKTPPSYQDTLYTTADYTVQKNSYEENSQAELLH